MQKLQKSIINQFIIKSTIEYLETGGMKAIFGKFSFILQYIQNKCLQKYYLQYISTNMIELKHN